jgi:molecular chaperone DnaK (HSP70)
MLRRAKEAGHPVESVVLIGGASSVPMIRELLKSAISIEPRDWVQKDVAVALGAACHQQQAWYPPTPLRAEEFVQKTTPL